MSLSLLVHTNQEFMTSWRTSWKFYENESSVKSIRTSISTYILSFVKIRLSLRKLGIWRNTQFTWRHSRHFESRKLPILKWAHKQGKLKLIVKTMSLITFGSGGVVRTKFWQKLKMAAILDVEYNIIQHQTLPKPGPEMIDSIKTSLNLW